MIDGVRAMDEEAGLPPSPPVDRSVRRPPRRVRCEGVPSRRRHDPGEVPSSHEQHDETEGRVGAAERGWYTRSTARRSSDGIGRIRIGTARWRCSTLVREVALFEVVEQYRHGDERALERSDRER